MVSWCSNYDEGMHVVFSGKAWHHIVLVFPYALYEIGCDTHIQGSVSAAGQKIDARLHNSRSILDSGLRRNDAKLEFSTFYETINFIRGEKSPNNGQAIDPLEISIRRNQRRPVTDGRGAINRSAGSLWLNRSS